MVECQVNKTLGAAWNYITIFNLRVLEWSIKTLNLVFFAALAYTRYFFQCRIRKHNVFFSPFVPIATTVTLISLYRYTSRKLYFDFVGSKNLLLLKLMQIDHNFQNHYICWIYNIISKLSEYHNFEAASHTITKLGFNCQKLAELLNLWRMLNVNELFCNKFFIYNWGFSTIL